MALPLLLERNISGCSAGRNAWNYNNNHSRVITVFNCNLNNLIDHSLIRGFRAFMKRFHKIQHYEILHLHVFWVGPSPLLNAPLSTRPMQRI